MNEIHRVYKKNYFQNPFKKSRKHRRNKSEMSLSSLTKNKVAPSAKKTNKNPFFIELTPPEGLSQFSVTKKNDYDYNDHITVVKGNHSPFRGMMPPSQARLKKQEMFEKSSSLMVKKNNDNGNSGSGRKFSVMEIGDKKEDDNINNNDYTSPGKQSRFSKGGKVKQLFFFKIKKKN